MIIRDLRTSRANGTRHLHADVACESRPGTHTLSLSVPEAHADWFHLTPHTFLTASIMAALWHGEPRVALDAPVDAQLIERLGMAMRYLRHEHRFSGPLPRIEAVPDLSTWREPAGAVTGIFLSGGVDSTAALYRNTERHPPGDPRRASVAFFAHGLDVGEPNKIDRPDVWALATERLDALCRSLGVTLIPVCVNFRQLEKHWHFYAEWQFASLLAAIAHAAGKRLFRCIIAPDNDIEHTVDPHGSHPWLNRYFGTDALEIVTGDMEQFSRLDKIRMLARHPARIDALRVCWDAAAIPAGHLNCGRCAKCVRTMVEFLACGQPDGLRAFPVDTVTPDMLKVMNIPSIGELEYLAELPAPLEAAGRPDLARPIRCKVGLFHLAQCMRLDRLRPVAKRLLNRTQQNTP